MPMPRNGILNRAVTRPCCRGDRCARLTGVLFLLLFTGNAVEARQSFFSAPRQVDVAGEASMDDAGQTAEPDSETDASADDSLRDRMQGLMSTLEQRVELVPDDAGTEPDQAEVGNADGESAPPVETDSTAASGQDSLTTELRGIAEGSRGGPVMSGFLGMLVQQLYKPPVQLLLVLGIAGILALVWVSRPARQPKNYQQGDEGLDFSTLALSEIDGVTLAREDSIATIDVDDDEPWDTAAGMDEEEDDDEHGFEDEDVDLLTQSDVYLAYGRPMQAIQVLEEEYARPGGNRYGVAARMFQAFRKLDDTPERKQMLRAFVTTLNADRQHFSSSEWDRLRETLRELRGSRQRRSARDDSGAPARVASSGRSG